MPNSPASAALRYPSEHTLRSNSPSAGGAEAGARPRLDRIAGPGTGEVAFSCPPSLTGSRCYTRRSRDGAVLQPDCDSCGACVREHSGGHPPKSRPSRPRDARGRAMGAPTAEARARRRACTPERPRADAGPETHGRITASPKLRRKWSRCGSCRAFTSGSRTNRRAVRAAASLTGSS
jgi:hypothetical protein